jgi:5'-nucleotidase
MKILTLMTLLLLVPAAASCADAPWFQRVLVTNDDGIGTPQIAAVARAFAGVAEVVVVAPEGNCSGSTNYVSAFQRNEVAVREVDLGPGITAYAVDGFPGDCVLLALTGLMAHAPPDLVVSGVNSGPNLADAYLASGTIGAARLAAQHGLPAIAFSNLDDEDAAMMRAVPMWCVDLAASQAARALEPGQYLTVNFPDGPPDRIRGVVWAAPGEQVFHDRFEPAGVDDQGRRIWRQRWWFDDGDRQPEDGDVVRQRTGWITVTPMRLGDLDTGRLGSAELPAWPRGEN